MKILKNNNGFTSNQLLMFIIIGVITLWIIAISAIVKCNYWYTTTDVLKKIQIDHPNATEIVDTNTNFFKYSVITVKENEIEKKYYLDTNSLFKYQIHEEN
ncbi:MAG: hypothetical protein ABIC36_01150 [bacterium]